MTPWYCVQRKWRTDQDSIKLSVMLRMSKARAVNNHKGWCLTVNGNLKGHFANRTLRVTRLTPTQSFHCHSTKQRNYCNLPKGRRFKEKKQNKTLSPERQMPAPSAGTVPFWRQRLPSCSGWGFSSAFLWPLCVSIRLLLFYPSHFRRYYRLPLVPRQSLKKHLKTKQRAGLHRGGRNAQRIQPVEMNGELCWTDLSTHFVWANRGGKGRF